MTMTIASRLDDVRLIGLAVNKLCENIGMDETERAHVELCVVEAATNSVRHAYEGRDDGEVSVRVEIDDEHVEIDVMDFGSPVPEECRTPRPLTLDEDDPLALQEGGRGLFLIYSLMDDVHFSRRGERNSLRMVKSLARV
jgi:serine/threonine-protein kinase RsbW